MGHGHSRSRRTVQFSPFLKLVRSSLSTMLHGEAETSGNLIVLALLDGGLKPNVILISWVHSASLGATAPSSARHSVPSGGHEAMEADCRADSSG